MADLPPTKMPSVQWYPATALEDLEHFDTCTLCNAIERYGLRLKNQGYTDHRITCRFPEQRLMVGRAVTLRIHCSSPPPGGMAFHERQDWWDEIIRIPPPRILVIEDSDPMIGRGALIGEAHAHVFRALACVGVVTNGSVRDLPALGLMPWHVFSGSTSPSHAYAHIVEVGCHVTVAGLSVAPGDLLVGDVHGVLAIPPTIIEQLPVDAADIRRRDYALITSLKPHMPAEELRQLIRNFDFSDRKRLRLGDE